MKETEQAKENKAETLRRYVRALQPVTQKSLGDALGWTNELTRMTAKAMVKRGHLYRDAEGRLTIGEPPKKSAGNGRYSRKPDAPSVQARNAAIAQHFRHKEIGFPNGMVQIANDFESVESFLARGGAIQRLQPWEVSAAARISVEYAND